MPQMRVTVDGKFFRLGDQKFYVKGVAYGPFPPDGQGQHFVHPDQTAADFSRIAEMGANVVRVYHVPPRWLLDLAAERGLRLLIDIPWNKRGGIESPEAFENARALVRQSVLACANHPAVFAYCVGNEIAPDIVRWSGPQRVVEFIGELIAEAKRVDPRCLCTYSNYPPTEFLQTRATDFISFNVYLHHRSALTSYLARLQMLADGKPLVLSEFGIDSLREGEERKSAMLAWQIETAFRSGLAGTLLFTFTDEWYANGQIVEDWQMGVVTANREPKPSFEAVRKFYSAAPYFPLKRYPKVSIVVASYNGERTLAACLQSLKRIRYPDFEILLVDDGSIDSTRRIAAAHPEVRFLRHETNLGLSVARNTGIAAATGEIIAFTDSDCRADEDWLFYLVATMLETGYAGAGGPNLLPPEDSPVAAAVMASPGGPAHVMLTDIEAEHIPGCNMAFYKWALDDIGGFDPKFARAGDDVDICWRLQQAGFKIAFSPAAFVWHYRRSTVRAYLRQQHGYGEAEALLTRKHPENFNSLGGGLWRGRIYGSWKFGVDVRAPVIYHGLFGSAGFQKVYASQPATILMLCTALEYHLFVMLPLWVVSAVFHPLLPVAIVATLIPAGVCIAAGIQAVIPLDKWHWWSRPLVGLLFFLQPIVRGSARYRGRLAVRPLTLEAQQSLDSIALRNSGKSLDEVCYRTNTHIDRIDMVGWVIQRLEKRNWPHRVDAGWSEHDVEIYGSLWSHLQLTTAAEFYVDAYERLRCRLRPVLSLTSKIVLALAVCIELLLVAWLSAWRPWIWLLLLSLPLGVWLLKREQRSLQSIAIVFLDQIAEEHGLARNEDLR